MATIPKKADTRIRAGLGAFKKVIQAAKDRDVNESDTVTILTDMLAEICGYDKYAELTREFAIRNTYCDLAIKIDGEVVFLIEVKAIGIPLKENHLRQAIGYAANEGIEWVILTNGDHWQAHRVIFGKPVKREVAFDFSFLETSSVNQLVDFFFLISKEGVKKSAISQFHEESQLTSRYMLAAVIQSEPVLNVIRRQLRSLGSNVKITPNEISQTIQSQVIKRDVLEAEEFKQARKRLSSALRGKRKVSSEKIEENA